ncbi:DUF2254 domain-containing protein [Notoacmeibacter sp. MSK16QG-6]|uniref:DUF2254 domain-containing protein n=1 Tax=Notoacmeibacter sp. MSK16QG-6 TaxID=2957982 RepID=UPI0020A1F623|nr:DUF2254 domain-containing protein [Notoacmeibacter sp. MSK16QG-6]MCP1200714.1 DUF2254 domain-containing protein [Notoacmeibacter sp. MSK16QG-6]
MRIRLKRFWRWLKGRLWVRPAVYCVVAIATVTIATTTDTFIPEIAFLDVSVETIESLLTIIASSMLAVATFAVSVMVSTYNAALSSTTPRAFEIVVSDTSTRQAISSFIGAFIFAMIGLIGVNFSYFGSPGRVVLFMMTLAVFIWVVGTFVYWIDHVTRMGQLRHTIERVADHATQLLAKYIANPARMGVLAELDEAPPQDGRPIYPRKAGIVIGYSCEDIRAAMGDGSWGVFVDAIPGATVSPRDPLIWVRGVQIDEETEDALRDCFEVGPVRTLSEDPVMGLRILGEIAERALSPGINDPGTAIDIIDTVVSVFNNARIDAQNIGKWEADDRIRVRAISPDALISSAFMGIGRDGAGSVEVAEELQLSLRSLHQILPTEYNAPLRRQAKIAFAYVEKALTFDWERDRVRNAAGFLLEDAEADDTASEMAAQSMDFSRFKPDWRSL